MIEIYLAGALIVWGALIHASVRKNPPAPSHYLLITGSWLVVGFILGEILEKTVNMEGKSS